MSATLTNEYFALAVSFYQSSSPVDLRTISFAGLLTGKGASTPTGWIVDYGDGVRDELIGDIDVSSSGVVTGGRIDAYQRYVNGNLVLSLAGGPFLVGQFLSYLQTEGAQANILFFLSGDDRVVGSSFSDYLIGGPGKDIISGLNGDDTIYGGEGDDQLLGGNGSDYVDGGAGNDAAVYTLAPSAVVANLSYTHGQDTRGSGVDTIVNVENLTGSAFGDFLIGDAGANGLDGGNGNDWLDGGAGNDFLLGGAGDDTLIGGAGDDRIFAGDGEDTARYGGTMTDYSVVRNNDDTITVTDLRPGAPDGSDVLVGVEKIRFGPIPSSHAVDTGISSILRLSIASAALSPLALDLLTKWMVETLTAEQVTQAIVVEARATTSVATLAYEFFTGKIPGQAGIDYLVSPTGPNANNLNSAYYQSFNLENRYINFAVNLGKVGEGAAKFTTDYGALSLFEATRKAYAAIFGGTPNDAKVHALIDTRVDYFASYGGDGANGIGTKAAMVGWLLAEAEKADVGVMARSNAAWLTDLADGSAPFSIDILDPSKGYYKADFVFGG